MNNNNTRKGDPCCRTFVCFSIVEKHQKMCTHRKIALHNTADVSEFDSEQFSFF